MEIDTQTSARLADAFQAFCDSPDRIVMAAGYRDSAFAVVDSVFSMQARYEGVQRVVANYASYANIPQVPGLPVDASERDQHSVRDLHDRLHGLSAEEAATKVFGNRSRHARADQLKAGLVLDVASRLVDAGVHTRQDVALLPNATSHSEQKRAWTAVRGLGPVTFEYFRMLCGAESSKPDTMILGWLADTLGQRFTWQHALDLIAALTDELSHRWGVPIAQRGVDHTIWRQQSGRSSRPVGGWTAPGSTAPSGLASRRARWSLAPRNMTGGPATEPYGTYAGSPQGAAGSTP